VHLVYGLAEEPLGLSLQNLEEMMAERGIEVDPCDISSMGRPLFA
jgi:hypothetical protein